jgi:hypothetical protein
LCSGEGIERRDAGVLTYRHLPFAFADNYLIDLKAAIILDIKVTHAHTHQHGS